MSNATENTIVRAAYISKKLAKPKVRGNTAYWTPAMLDAWIDADG